MDHVRQRLVQRVRQAQGRQAPQPRPCGARRPVCRRRRARKDAARVRRPRAERAVADGHHRAPDSGGESCTSAPSRTCSLLDRRVLDRLADEVQAGRAGPGERRRLRGSQRQGQSRRIESVVATPRSWKFSGMATSDWSRNTSDMQEGARRQWRADRALRPAMRSPGRPEPWPAVQRQF